MLEKMAWDASVMSVSAETDAAVMSIAMVAGTTEQSRWPFSTGVGTDMLSSTRALEDDEAMPPRPGSGVAQPLSNEDRSDIVQIADRKRSIGDKEMLGLDEIRHQSNGDRVSLSDRP